MPCEIISSLEQSVVNLGEFNLRKKKIKIQVSWILAVLIFVSVLFSGCSSENISEDTQSDNKTFILGDTTFNSENEEPDINPHNAYSGWACIRYGVGETLFKYTDDMKIEPWLASDYELEDELTWKIELRDDVTFSNGRKLDAQSVKECLEHLTENHLRAQSNLTIESISAEGQTLIIKTSEPCPTMLNYLCDPYACIIDMQAGIKEEGIVTGTGPYIATELITDEELKLEKNQDYWNGEPGFDNIRVLTISDGDTLTMALLSGEIDAAYGMSYVSYPLFENENYSFSSTATARAFFISMNFESTIIQDDAVRKAIALSIDKNRFVDELLGGHGYVADGAFPSSFTFGGDALSAEEYDPEEACAVLEAAGWIDTDGDGIREKNGEKLTIRWLTYPSRQELPLLAESAQATLGAVGFDVIINSTADHNSIRSDSSAWDVYASAMVTAPTGDAENFFASHCLDTSASNNGHYHNDKLETLADELDKTFDTELRTELAIEMQKIILDDNAFVFCSHLQMSLISKSSVTGFTAHPCDYYEITAELKPSE